MDKQNMGSGLIVGMDITKYDVQVSCLSLQDKNAETISTRMGVDRYEIPICLFKKTDSQNWYYGDRAKQNSYAEDGIYVEDLWEGMLKNRELICEDETYTYESLMKIFLEKIMVLLSQNGYSTEIAALVFTTETMDSHKITCLRRIAAQLPVKDEQVFCVDYKESFAAYATNAEKDLWNHDVFLFHYEGRELKAYQLHVSQKTLPSVISLKETDYGELEYGKEELDASPEAREEMDSRFEATAQELLARKIVSCVYLVGDGFLPGWMKKSLQVLCRGRRVFQGNNLFSKGACYAARRYIRPQKSAGEYISSQMLSCSVRIPVMKNGNDSGYICAAQPGDLWYRAGLEKECVTCSTDTENSAQGSYETPVVRIEIAGEKAEGQTAVRTEILELKQLPKRPKKASRIKIKVDFADENTGRILVEDMGFGELYVSSGLRWEKTFSLKVQDEILKEGAGA